MFTPLARRFHAQPRDTRSCFALSLGGANPPLDSIGFRWQNGTQQAFAISSASAYVRATYQSPSGMTWTRSINSIHPDENYPILAIRDGFTGRDANSNKILTLNLMASGAGSTPKGTVLSLPPGLNKFEFTGQWLNDWYLYTFGDQPMQAILGSWTHHWHPGREQSEFAKANGRPFEEQQYILRLRGTNNFTTLLLPYRKGQRHEMDVKMQGSKIVIAQNGSTTVVDGDCYSYNTANANVRECW